MSWDLGATRQEWLRLRPWLTCWRKSAAGDDWFGEGIRQAHDVNENGLNSVKHDGTHSADDVGIAAQLACLLEVSASKPGNVSPGHHFGDTRYEHFLASAVAIGGALRNAGTRPLGATIRFAVEATRHWTQSNTNLGIVLLLAPVARAALSGGGLLRDAIREVLQTTTIEDARDVYAAIRLAAPGGLGRADAQDVRDEPTLPLLDVMKLAADRDAIAREYAHAFETTFNVGVPALERARHDNLDWNDAVVETFLTLLSSASDTHVARRAGTTHAVEISRDAGRALESGGVRSPAGRSAIAALDQHLRDPGNRLNPGATADLTAAAIFVVLLSGGWHAGGTPNHVPLT